MDRLLTASEVFREKFREPEWLSRFRRKSLDLFTTLPVEVSQLYVRHHEAPQIDSENILKMLKLEDGREVPQRFKLLQESENEPVVIHVGSSPAHIHLPKKLEKQGVKMISIPEAITRYPELLEELFSNKLASSENDKYAALNNGLFSSGVLINIPEDAEIDETFRLVWILDRPEEAVFSQVIVRAEPNSRASIIEESYGPLDSGSAILSIVTELYLGEGAQVKYASMQNLGEDAIHLANRVVSAGKDSSLTWVGALIGGSNSRVKIDSRLDGDGARVNDLEIVFGGGRQAFDLTSNLIHTGVGTQGRVLAKGVVKDSARSIFKGIIGIESKAKNTSAYLAEHAMILSSDARAYAIPGLEISSNEVKATHSASVAQIDEEQVYYLTARGIPENEARKMIAMSFFEPVVSEIDVSEVRWGIRYLLERKWLPREEAESLTPEQLVELYVEPEEAGKPIEDIFGRHYKYR